MKYNMSFPRMEKAIELVENKSEIPARDILKYLLA